MVRTNDDGTMDYLKKLPFHYRSALCPEMNPCPLERAEKRNKTKYHEFAHVAFQDAINSCGTHRFTVYQYQTRWMCCRMVSALQLYISPSASRVSP